jgi:hypothetical protein
LTCRLSRGGRPRIGAFRQPERWSDARHSRTRSDPSFAKTAYSGWVDLRSVRCVGFAVIDQSRRGALNRRAGTIIVQQIEHRSLQSRSTAIIRTPELSDPV